MLMGHAGQVLTAIIGFTLGPLASLTEEHHRSIPEFLVLETAVIKSTWRGQQSLSLA